MLSYVENNTIILVCRIFFRNMATILEVQKPTLGLLEGIHLSFLKKLPIWILKGVSATSQWYPLIPFHVQGHEVQNCSDKVYIFIVSNN